jgi:hypothetical protein
MPKDQASANIFLLVEGEGMPKDQASANIFLLVEGEKNA